MRGIPNEGVIMHGAGLILMALLAAGCAQEAHSAAQSALVDDVPHVRQKPDFCGEACAEMALRKLGHTISQDDVFNASGMNPALGRGCTTPWLAKALTALGFDIGEVWYRVPSDSPREIHGQWDALCADLRAGIPSIVCMRTDDTARASEHFRLILGYHAALDEVIYHEPAEDNAAYRRMPLKTFLACWPLKYEARTWTLIRFRCKPGRIAKTPPAKGFSSADYVQHIIALKAKLPADLTILVEEPFVVVGDGGGASVKRFAEQTVRWAVEKLKASYFRKDPAEIIDICLFKDDASYRRHAREIFDDEPDTPFGYSSEEHHALIMNIATGGGTLVHEIVHPFMAANFPACPSWFNEGLGSLYEQAGERDGAIVGRTNWRLAGLQKAIRDGRVPSFKTLLSTSRNDFYRTDPGTNYAQSRYLCYYLQEKGLLTSFYHRFVRDCAADPTGYDTLQAVLAEKDMEAFQKEWARFVLALRFPS
jgi:hypothetical protein